MKKLASYLLAAIVFLTASGFYIAETQNTEVEKYPTLALGSKIPSGKGMMKGVDGVETDLIGQAKSSGLLVIFSSNTCPFVVNGKIVILCSRNLQTVLI